MTNVVRLRKSDRRQFRLIGGNETLREDHFRAQNRRGRRISAELQPVFSNNKEPAGDADCTRTPPSFRLARLVARIGNPMHLYAALVNKRDDAPLFDNSAGFCAAIVAVAPAAIDLILSTSRGRIWR